MFLNNALSIITAVLCASAAVTASPAAPRPDSGTRQLKARASNIHKVKDLTGPNLTGKFQAQYTDGGIPARTPDGRMIFLCGDTFTNLATSSNWRSPIALYSSNANLDNITIDGAVGGSSAVQLVPENHAGGKTALPSDAFAVNGKLYMTLLRGKMFQADRSELWASDNNGASWRYVAQWAANAYNGALQQKTCALSDGGVWVYCLSTISNREAVSDLLLHRVLASDVENINAWVPWGYKNGQWAWGNPATTIAPARKWGEISWRNLGGGKWVFTWLNIQPVGIHYMVLNGPLDNLFVAEEKVLILPAPDLRSEHDGSVAHPYGGFIFPGSTLAKFDFSVSQWIDDTYRFMQFRANLL